MVHQNYEQFRTIESYWIQPEWLRERMLFLSGPRQVGKTTLVTTRLCPSEKGYYNWDSRKIRLAYQKDPDFFSNSDAKWICFDEIHKRPKWKDILKGIYDTNKNRFRFVITGSARLDSFKKSGDSLVGRYFHTQLFPLNLSDFSKIDFDKPENPLTLIKSACDLKDSEHLEGLLNLSGFPEPFFASSQDFWERWTEQHRDLIISEDIRDLTRVVEIDKIEMLLDMLKPTIGNTISNNSLAQDLEANHESIRRWLEILRRVQLVFPVTPYSKKIHRAYKKEKKWYFTNWSSAENNVFENYIAASLLRAVTLWTNRFGKKMSLHFIRTHDQTEVDFLICKKDKPWLLVEAKEGTPEISSAVHRFTKELDVPCFIVTKKKNLFREIKDQNSQKIFLISWAKLGQVLP